ncbi:MAG: tandem-95 repeat protein [Pirellulaceae bacterium]|nr:tandem-95 repeat protein [Pirellulaceae bacterium]
MDADLAAAALIDTTVVQGGSEDVATSVLAPLTIALTGGLDVGVVASIASGDPNALVSAGATDRTAFALAGSSFTVGDLDADEDPGAVASVRHDFGGAPDIAVIFEAAVPGAAGDAITIAITKSDLGTDDPAPQITVVGNAIDIECNTQAGFETTLDALKLALDGDAAAAALINTNIFGKTNIDITTPVPPGIPAWTELLLQLSGGGVDGDPNHVQVTLDSVNGTLAATEIGSVVATFNPSDTQVVLDGLIADINATLATLLFTPDLDFNDTQVPPTPQASITISTDDLGNYGIGLLEPSLLDADPAVGPDTLWINVLAVNDEPVNIVPETPRAALEDLPLIFSHQGTLSFPGSGVDLQLQVDAAVTQGVAFLVRARDLSVATASTSSDFNTAGAVGIDFVADSAGAAGNAIELVVTSADLATGDAAPQINVVGSTINVELNAEVGFETTADDLKLALDNDPNAAALLDTTVVQGGDVDIATSAIDYSPLTLSGGADAASLAIDLYSEAGGDVVGITLDNAGLTTAAELVAALDGLAVSGGLLSATQTSGFGTDLIDTATDIGTQLHDHLGFSLLGQLVSFIDVDAEEIVINPTMEIVLDATNGVLDVVLPLGVDTVPTGGTTSGATSLTLSGGWDELKTALSTIVFTPQPEHFNDTQTAPAVPPTASLTVSTHDLGNHGIGVLGPLVDSDTIGIHVLPVNDPPEISSIQGKQAVANQIVPDAIFAVDISGSARQPFSGDPVGDLNGDGRSDTILDAEIAGYIALNNQLIADGFGSVADVSVVAFSTQATHEDMDPVAPGVQVSTAPNADADNNGVNDVEDVLRSLQTDFMTNYEAALQEAIFVLDAMGTLPQDGNVIFLSDGDPSAGGAYDDEAAAIRSRVDNFRAFGVGGDVDLANLLIIDPLAETFSTTDELLAAFDGLIGGTPPGVAPAPANPIGLEDAPVGLTDEFTTDLNSNGAVEITFNGAEPVMLDVRMAELGVGAPPRVTLFSPNPPIPGDPPIVTVFLNSSTGQATASSDFNTAGAVQIQFAAVALGTAGDGITIDVVKNDHQSGVSDPILTVVGNALTIDLNTELNRHTTAQDVIDAVNNDPAAAALLSASLAAGDGATDVSAPAINYSPLTLTGGLNATSATELVDVINRNGIIGNIVNARVASGNRDATISAGPTGRTMFGFRGSSFFLEDLDLAEDPSDPLSGQVRVTIDAEHGLMDATALGSVVLAGTGTAQLTLQGPLSEVNDSLKRVVFTPAQDFNDTDIPTIGPANVTLTVYDLANHDTGTDQSDPDHITGLLGNLLDTLTLNMSFLPLNDETVNTVPTSLLYVLEDETLHLTDLHTVDLNGVHVEFGATDPVSIEVRTLPIFWTSDPVVILEPPSPFITEGRIGILLDSTPGQEATANDLVAALAGHANLTAAVVSGLGSDPIASGFGEVVSFGLSGSTLRVDDVDVHETTNSVEVLLEASNGRLSLDPALTGSFTFLQGDGASDPVIEIYGDIDQVNAALATAQFLPNPHYNDTDIPTYLGQAQITMTSRDLGVNGIGMIGAFTDVDQVDISVTPVNDAPLILVPPADSMTGIGETTIEDQPLSLRTDQIVTDLGTGGASLGGADLMFRAAQQVTVTINAADLGAGAGPLVTADFNARTVDVVLNTDALSGFTGSSNPTTVIELVETMRNDVDVSALVFATVLSGDLDADLTANLVVPHSFSLNGNAIQVFDADVLEGDEQIEVTLQATNGILELTTQGTASITAGGSGSSDVTLLGDFSDVNATLDTLNFVPDANYNDTDIPTLGPATIQVDCDDQGNFGLYTPLTDSQLLTISVQPENDAPVVSVPASPQATDEDTPLVFSTSAGNPIVVFDVDSGEGTDMVSVTLTAANGLVSLDPLAVIALTSVKNGSGAASNGQDEATLLIEGLLADVNAALDGLVFTPAADFNDSHVASLGPASLTVFADDLGNHGVTGLGALTDQESVLINVEAVNDGPSLIVPLTQTTLEDTAISFDSATGNQISVFDIDAEETTGIVQVALVATNGTLSIGGVTGITFLSGSTGFGDQAMTFQGTLSDVNTALNGLSFLPDPDFNDTDVLLGLGKARIDMAVDDLGNSGTGGPLTANATVEIDVLPVNDAPTIVAPNSATTLEDAPLGSELIFSSANGNAIEVADVDVSEGTGNVQVVLTAISGSLQATPASTAVSITANGTPVQELIIEGPLADVNATLDGLVFGPGPVEHFNDSWVPPADAARLDIFVDDLGNSPAAVAPAPASLTDTTTIDISVTPVNDPPQSSYPMGETTNEDTPLVFSSTEGNRLSVSDIDGAEGTNEVLVTLSVSHGTLTLGSVDNLLFGAGDGNEDATVTIRGDVDDINHALDGLTFTPPEDFNGVATVEMIVGDLGNSGVGGQLIDQDSFDITVQPVNDAPVITAVSSVTTLEGVPVLLSSTDLTEISIADLDVAEGTGEVEVTLTATHGVVSLDPATLSALTSVSGDGDGQDETTLQIQGLLADVNAALAQVTFSPDPSFNDVQIPISGPAQLDVHVDDLANFGTVAATDDATIVIQVTPDNDAPNNSVPADQTIDEDQPLVFNAINGNLISVADEDVREGDGRMRIGLTATGGVLSLNPGVLGDLTFEPGQGDGTSHIVFTADIDDVNAALEGMTFTPDLDLNGTGAGSITLNSNDLGGSPGPIDLADVDTFLVNINAINDAPEVSASASNTTDEEVPLTFSPAVGNAIAISDADAEEGTNVVSVTLAANHGTLLLGTTVGVTITNGQNGTASFAIEGSLGDVNTAIDGLIYTPDTNFHGVDTITVTPDDLGNFGAPGNAVVPLGVDVAVNAVNDAPTSVGPGLQTIDEDHQLVFSASNGNAIEVDDVDFTASDEFQITLTANGGTLELGDTAGLTSAIIGDGTATVVFSGTKQAVNDALEGLTFTPTLHLNDVNNGSPAAEVTIETSDQGQNPAPALSDVRTIDISIDPRNDAPVNHLSATPLQTLEDEATTFVNQFSISDPDALEGDGVLRVQLTAEHGRLSVANTSQLNFLVGSGTDDTTMTFSGSLSEINTALAHLTFAPAAGYNGVDGKIHIETNDLGQFPAAALVDLDTVEVHVEAMNDAPLMSHPVAATVDEDAELILSQVGGNGIDVTDVDIDETGTAGTLIVDLAVQHGTLTIEGDLAGLTNPPMSAAATVRLEGTLADVREALAVVRYAPAADFNGTDTLTMAADDQGSSGLPGPTNGQTLTSFDIEVTPINDQPIHDVPGIQTMDEDGVLVFSADNGNAIHVSDPDGTEAGGNDEMEVTLTASHGTVTLGLAQLGLLGLLDLEFFGDSDGIADVEMTFQGTAADVQAALEDVRFQADPDHNDPTGIVTQLTITSSDLGNGGLDQTELVTTSSIPIVVTPSNDAPSNIVPAGLQTTREDESILFSAENGDLNSVDGNLISVADVDLAEPGATGRIQVSLEATDGTVSLLATAIPALTFSIGSGSDDAAVTFEGLLADVVAALSELTFTPLSNFNGLTAITMTSNDLGNSADGVVLPALTDVDQIDILVEAVNDAPTSLVPGPQTIDEDHVLRFHDVNEIQIEDIDAGSEDVEVTLNATHGTITLSSLGTVDFFDGDGVADATVTFRGSVAEVNTVLADVDFTPDPDFGGLAALELISDDLGNTGLDGPLNDSDIISIDVIAQNDLPVHHLPAGQVTQEDTPIAFGNATANRLWISDVDITDNTSSLEVTLTATSTLTLATTNGLSFSAGDGAGDATMTFQGNLVAINAALDGLVYQPGLDFNGNGQIEITTNDLGNIGAGGPQVVTDTVAIDVLPVNDPPVISMVTADAVTEDVVHHFGSATNNAIEISDVDLAEGPSPQVQVTMMVTHGLFSLSGLEGLDFASGDGANDETMQFTGTLDDVTAALENSSFTPDSNFFGTATLTATVSDLGNFPAPSLSDVATMTLAVAAVNDKPLNQGVLSPQTTDEDVPIVFSAAQGNQLAVSDVDALSGTGEMTVTLLATHGTVVVSSLAGINIASGGNGTATLVMEGNLIDINAALSAITLTPDANFHGTAALRIVSDDNNNFGAGGVQTDDDVIDIHVTSVNDAPVAEDDAQVTQRGDAIVVDVIANDTDVDGTIDPATLTMVTGSGPLNGFATVDLSTGEVTYTPNSSFTGVDSFQYFVADNEGASSNPATVTVTVNDPPVAENDYVAVEFNTSVVFDLLANDTDSDGTLLPSSIVYSNASHGNVIVNGDGVATYVPDQDYIGPDEFSYTVSDDQGGVSNTARVVIDVIRTSPHQNPDLRFDVNADGFVTAIDALLILNAINLSGGISIPLPPVAENVPPYLDVDGDGQVAGIDAILVTEYINMNSGIGAGEAPASASNQNIPADVRDLSGDDLAKSEFVGLSSPDGVAAAKHAEALSLPFVTSDVLPEEKVDREWSPAEAVPVRQESTEWSGDVLEDVLTEIAEDVDDASSERLAIDEAIDDVLAEDFVWFKRRRAK